MNKTTEALKLAEEALEGWKEYDTWTDQQMWNDDDEEALAAIREALAEKALGEYHGKLMREVCNKVITKTLAEPVKQEPVAEVRVRPLRGNESAPQVDVKWVTKPTTGFLYAAPVSAKMQGDCTLAAVLAEREACAKVCDEQLKHDWNIQHKPALVNCAAAIRARGEK